MKLPSIEAHTLAALIGVTSDLALVIDKDGVVQDVSVKKDDLASLACHTWIGKAWLDTVAQDSQGKVRDMLASASDGAGLRWRHVNHPSPQGVDVPMQYAVVRFESDGRFLALGRDMEALAAMQRRLVETQQAMERDYLRLRHIETRYRILFDTTIEAVMLVDSNTLRVTEVNLSAQALLKDATKRLVGREVMEAFEPASREEIQALMRMAYATGRVEMRKARFLGAVTDCTVTVSVFRQENGAQFLVRLLPQETAKEQGGQGVAALLSQAMERAPDGFVLTDRSGSIKAVNAEFMSIVGATASSQLNGQALEQWFVRGGIDWGVLNTNLRQQTAVKDFATNLLGFTGTAVAVEIAALTLQSSESEVFYAFYVRDVTRRQLPEVRESSGMSDSVAQLARLVGRLPMKDIVGETVDMIERMCIKSALDLTHNNRASAAEMLGLSRQSLYVKLRRHGMVTEGETD
jgi:transcriptional regulator PpsR